MVMMKRKYCRDSPWLNHSSNYQKSSKRKTRIYRKEENTKEQSQRGRISQNRLKPETYKKTMNFHWLKTKINPPKQTNKRIGYSTLFLLFLLRKILPCRSSSPLSSCHGKGSVLRGEGGRPAPADGFETLRSMTTNWGRTEVKLIWKRCKIQWAKERGNWNDLFSSPRPTQEFQPRYSHKFNRGKRNFLFLTLKAHLHAWPSPGCPWAPAPPARSVGPSSCHTVWEQLIPKDTVRFRGGHEAKDSHLRAPCFHSHQQDDHSSFLRPPPPQCTLSATHKGAFTDCCSHVAEQHGWQEAGKRLKSTCTPGFWRISHWSFRHSRWEQAGQAGHIVFSVFPQPLEGSQQLIFFFFFLSTASISADRLL